MGAKLSLVLYSLLTFNTPPAEEQLQDRWNCEPHFAYIPSLTLGETISHR